MKGGLMAGLMALTYIQEANVRLHGDVIFQSVVNEEHSGNGTLDLVRQKYKADAAIVLEPTENRVCTEHPGGVYWEIKIPGIAKSPGARWRHGVCVGISAIEKLPLLVNSLLHLEEQLNHGSKSSSRDTVEAAFSMVIGKIKGGHYETATASELTVRGVAYFSPSVGKVESVMDKLKCAVEKCNQSDEFLTKYPAEIKFLHHDDSATQTSAIAIAQHAQRILNARENNTAITSGPFCCDMRHLVNRANIPTIIFGPGTIEQAHKPDENISIEQYLKSIEHLIELIITWSNCNIS
jgi:acetylornithine deacetylase